MIITGKINEQHLFQAIKDFEVKLTNTYISTSILGEKPFSKDYPLLEENFDKEVFIPGEKGERQNSLKLARIKCRD